MTDLTNPNNKDEQIRKLTWALELANESVKIWKERAEKAERELAVIPKIARLASMSKLLD